jgi:SAM-dependent methyltransferase
MPDFTGKTFLDIGCGTGNHDILFAKKGYKIDGFDLSEEMIEIAKSRINNSKNNNINFYQGNSENFKIEKKYDVVVSLFHVMNYQTTNEALCQSFKTAYDHLGNNGLFIFDFWYGPAVLTDRPSVRIKKLEDDELMIYRLATPHMHPNENIVDVNFEIKIKNKKTDESIVLNELHRMRYLFLPELILMLNNLNFKILNSFEWMSLEKELSFNSWNGVIIIKK